MNTLNHQELVNISTSCSEIKMLDREYIDIDTLWENILSTARSTSLSEPFLSSLLQRLVLKHQMIADSLATILAFKLCCKDMSEVKLYDIIHSVFEAEVNIVNQAALDIHMTNMLDPACPNYLHIFLNSKGFQSLQIFRVSHFLWKEKRFELAYFLSSLSSITFSVDIHPAAYIGEGVVIDHGTGIVIGETTVIEDYVSIFQNVTLGGTGKDQGMRHPKIRRGVMLGAGAKILGNIEVGTMSKVAAGSVVLNSVPSHCTVAGVPAKIVRKHYNENYPSFEMNQMI
jgi:serine O-acetyltransferase